MIKIIQAGQGGSSRLLFRMHRLRTEIFHKRMNWNVDVDEMELEIDEYDLPETIYLLAIDQNEKVVGTWRFLTTDRPSMIRNLWPQFLETLPIPQDNFSCETSRFGISPAASRLCEKHSSVSAITAEMITGLIHACRLSGIDEMYTLYDVSIMRLLDRIGFKPIATSDVMILEGRPTVTAKFLMNEQLQQQVFAKTNLVSDLTEHDLPPSLAMRLSRKLAA